jgi:hypothetical protein
MNAKNLTMWTIGLGLTALASAQEVRTELDGRPLNFDQPAMMQQGRVMVPLRGIFESLGADVLYDAARRSIKATKGDRVIELALGSRSASINGQSAYLDVPANSIGGRVMVPLRFVSEALGADVKWSAASRTVSLTSTDDGTDVGMDNGNTPQPQQPSTTGPNVSSVIHNARGNLNVGDRLVVTLTGDPGGQASFDVLGVLTNIPMREVFPGRYEGEMTVNSGMQVQRGTLVGRLRHNGRETVMESRRPVTFQNNVVGGVNPGNVNNLFDVSPLPGSQINTTRPTVQVNLANGLQPATARILLDGTDVTPQAQITGNTVRFIPNYDLAPGEHRVSIQAMDTAGRWINRDWNFMSYATPGGVNPYNPSALIPTITLTNISNGAAVTGVFSVQGQTKPFATVQVMAEARRDLIPGWVALQNFSRTNSAQADAWGRFNVQIDATQVPVSTPITLRVQANDPEGRTSQPAILQVVRR